jgi:hypothetical protein
VLLRLPLLQRLRSSRFLATRLLLQLAEVLLLVALQNRREGALHCCDGGAEGLRRLLLWQLLLPLLACGY